MFTIMKRSAKFALLAAVLVFTFSGPAQAQQLRGEFRGRVVPSWRFNLGVGPFYDPFWGSYYPYWYAAERPTAAVHVEGVPKQTEVFVDGYLAGTGGKVRTTPGGHAITLYLPGYRTVTENIYVAPGSTYKMREALDRVATGEESAPPPAPQPTTQLPTGAPR